MISFSLFCCFLLLFFCFLVFCYSCHFVPDCWRFCSRIRAWKAHRIPVTSLSRTCHDILPAKIHSPPRVPLSFCVRARLLIEVNWIIFIHSPTTEPIIVCAWLFGLLFEGEIWKKISVNTLEYTHTHGLKATKWGRQTISSPLTKWYSVYLVSEEPKLM